MPKIAQWKLDKQIELTNSPTKAEQILFDHLDDHWIFQSIVLGFIPDFTHHSARVILEADGAHHFTTAGKRSDARRDYIFRRNGWKVLRFPNSVIEKNLAKVLRIANACVRARLDNDAGVLDR